MPNSQPSQASLKGATQPGDQTRSPADKAKAAAIEAKAERIAERVRDNYAMGREANAAEANPGTSTTAFAEQEGVDPGTLRRWKLFARLYSDKPGTGPNGMSELDELCCLRRPNRLPLHWGFLPYLLSVKNRKKRRSFASEAAKNGWSPARLHLEIRRSEGRHEGHGRSVELPARPADAAQQVIREGRLWLSRVRKLTTELKPQSEAAKPSLMSLAEGDRNELLRLFREIGQECPLSMEVIESLKEPEICVTKRPQQTRTKSGHPNQPTKRRSKKA